MSNQTQRVCSKPISESLQCAPHIVPMGEKSVPCPKCTCERHAVIFLPVALTPHPHPGVFTPQVKARACWELWPFKHLMGIRRLPDVPRKATSPPHPAPSSPSPPPWRLREATGTQRGPSALQKQVATSPCAIGAKPSHKALFLKRYLSKKKKKFNFEKSSNSHKNKKR